MQTAENQTVSLRAIDGSLARPRITASHDCAPESAALANAIGELLAAAGEAAAAERRLAGDALARLDRRPAIRRQVPPALCWEHRYRAILRPMA